MNFARKLFPTLLAVICLMAANNTWAILAIDDSYIIPRDSTGYPIDPLANDIIQFTSLQPISGANFVLQAGQGTISGSQGNLVVIPAPGFVGIIEFGYIITDSTGTDGAKVIVDVQANAAPHQAVDDFHHVLQNDFPIPLPVLANDNFSLTNGVQITGVSPAGQGGTVNIDPGGQFITYQPPPGFSGEDTFFYDLTDQQTSVVSTALVKVFVGVTPGTNPPLANATTEEQGAIDVIDQICNDNPNGPLPCTLIATLSDDERQSLAQQVGGRHTKTQSRAIKQIKNHQGNNVRSRLSEIRGGQSRVSIKNVNTVMNSNNVPLALALQAEIDNQFGGGSAGEDGIASPWGFFINGNLSFGEGIGANDRPQYEQDGFNITSGTDYRVNDDLVVGAAFGYSQSNIDFSFNRGTQNSDSLTFSFFGNYYPTASIYIDWLAMLVQADLDINRRINVATFSQSVESETTSAQTVFATSLGWDFSARAWQGSLYARAEYSDLTIDAYSEGSGSAFQLEIGEQATESLDYAVGGRLAYVFSLRSGVFIPTLEVESVTQSDEELAIETRFAQVSTAQQGLQLNGAEADTQYVNAALSFSLVFSNGRSGFFRYESLLSNDDYQADSYTLGFRVEF